jgi:hypothetical protein
MLMVDLLLRQVFPFFRIHMEFIYDFSSHFLDLMSEFAYVFKELFTGSHGIEIVAGLLSFKQLAPVVLELEVPAVLLFVLFPVSQVLSVSVIAFNFLCHLLSGFLIMLDLLVWLTRRFGSFVVAWLNVGDQVVNLLLTRISRVERLGILDPFLLVDLIYRVFYWK